MRIDTKLIKKFLFRHIVFICFMAAGFAAGPWGLLIGIIAGIFVEIIVNRFKIENQYKKVMEGDARLQSGSEPFPGAVYASALAVYSLGDASAAAREAYLIFGRQYKADWGTFCRSAEDSAGLNGDLLVEYLAAELLRAMGKNETVPLTEIFKLLQVSEFNWDEQRGEKPSVYLAQLLNYRCEDDEITAAYAVLGLEKNASVTEVKQAHRKLASKYHPDKGGEATAADFIRVQKAYEKIMETKK